MKKENTAFLLSMYLIISNLIYAVLLHVFLYHILSPNYICIDTTIAKWNIASYRCNIDYASSGSVSL